MQRNWLGVLFCVCCILLVIIFITGCTGNDKEKNGNVLVTGESIAINQEEFYKYMKSSRGVSDMENYILLNLLREKYSIDTEDLDEALEVEKLSYIDFERTIEAQSKTEFDVRNQLELDLMLRKAIVEEADVSPQTLKLYYEDWTVNRVANQMAVENEELATKIKEELETGIAFSKILSTYKKENVMAVESKVELGEDSYIDDSLKESLQNLQKVGEVTIVNNDTYFFVYQLLDTGEKSTFEEDMSRVKEAYLETQFTSYNKERITREIVLAENLTSTDSYFENLFKQFTEK